MGMRKESDKGNRFETKQQQQQQNTPKIKKSTVRLLPFTPSRHMHTCFQESNQEREKQEERSRRPQNCTHNNTQKNLRS